MQALASTGPVLPVRFGTVLPDLAGLADLVEAREPEWHGRLGALEGHVELVVHARAAVSAVAGTPSEGPAGAPDDRATRPGTAYLLARAAELRREQELLDSLTAALRPVVSELRVLPGGEEVRLACLVEGSRTAALHQALAEWGRAGEGRSTTTTGPWPPYSFAEEEGAA